MPATRQATQISRISFRAIMNTAMRCSALSWNRKAQRASLTGMSLQVDVPDVFDRGSAAITDAVAGITVSYNRQFHIPPEVTLTLKGGTVIAIPKLTNVTAIDFTVVLVDPATNNQVTGSFTWSAHGY